MFSLSLSMFAQVSLKFLALFSRERGAFERVQITAQTLRERICAQTFEETTPASSSTVCRSLRLMKVHWDRNVAAIGTHFGFK